MNFKKGENKISPLFYYVIIVIFQTKEVRHYNYPVHGPWQ